MANYTIPADLALSVNDRLLEAGAPAPDRFAALAVLATILSTLAPMSYATRHKIGELADVLGIDTATLGRALRLLASVGAIHLIRRQGKARIGIVVPGRRALGPPRIYDYAPSGMHPPAV